MNKEELHRRAVKAATQSILRRGYEVIDTDWESVCGGHIDLVAKDHDELVFIDVTVSEDQEKGFLDGNPNQNQMEIMAARWLAASSPADGDLKVRFDTISLIVLNEQRAFMRHHTNVFSQA
jgi:putative endonuclease